MKPCHPTGYVETCSLCRLYVTAPAYKAHVDGASKVNVPTPTRPVTKVKKGKCCDKGEAPHRIRNKSV